MIEKGVWKRNGRMENKNSIRSNFILYSGKLSGKIIWKNYLEKLSGKTIWKKYMEKLSGKCEKFMRKIYAVSIIVSLVILRGKW